MQEGRGKRQSRKQGKEEEKEVVTPTVASTDALFLGPFKANPREFGTGQIWTEIGQNPRRLEARKVSGE